MDIEDKVEWKRISDFCKRQKGINITAKQMKELTTEDGDVKVCWWEYCSLFISRNSWKREYC